MTVSALSLSLGNPLRIAAVDIVSGVVDGTIDAIDGTPIEDTPNWSPGDGTPGDVVVKGGAIALDRLLANGVAYKNPQAGPGNKKVKATLIEIADSQGVIAPLVVDSDNYAGVTFDPAAGKLKATKRVAGSDTALGDAILAPVSGSTEIGAVTRGTAMWATVDGQIAGGPYDVSEVAAAPTSGIIAKGPASATAWISNYVSQQIVIGYGRGYGMAYGGHS